MLVFDTDPDTDTAFFMCRYYRDHYTYTQIVLKCFSFSPPLFLTMYAKAISITSMNDVIFFLIQTST